MARSCDGRPETTRGLVATLLRESLPLLLVTAAGLALRLPELGRESFWLDEAGRAAIAALPVGAIPSAVGVVELSPPLYHVLLHAWTRAVGGDDVAVRVLSVLLGTAAIPATYVLGRELVGRRAALLAALLAAASPLYVAYSREAAMYALLALLALLATIGLARYLRRGACGALALYGAAMLLALYTHYYALFLLAAQGVCVAWLAWRGELPSGAGRRWVAVQGALALCFMAWLPALWRQAGLAASVGDWASPDPVAALGDLARTLGVGLATDPAIVAASVAFVPALALGLWAVARRPGVLALLVCYALVPLGIALLAAYPLHAFRERGFIAVAFVPQLLVAAGLDALAGLGVGWTGVKPGAAGAGPRVARATRALAAVYGASLLALLLAGAGAQLGEPKEEWRSAGTLIAALGREGDVVYLQHYGGQLALDRYLPVGLPRRGLPVDFTWEQGYTARYWLEPADLEDRLAADLAGRRRAWAVLSHADGRGDQLLLDYMDARYAAVLRQDFFGVRVRLWELGRGRDLAEPHFNRGPEPSPRDARSGTRRNAAVFRVPLRAFRRVARLPGGEGTCACPPGGCWAVACELGLQRRII